MFRCTHIKPHFSLIKKMMRQSKVQYIKNEVDQTCRAHVTGREVEMRIWCIKIGIVLVFHFNLWVEASTGGLSVPEGFYSPVAWYFGTSIKIRIRI